jgi:hypothetical protein
MVALDLGLSLDALDGMSNGHLEVPQITESSASSDVVNLAASHDDITKRASREIVNDQGFFTTIGNFFESNSALATAGFVAAASAIAVVAIISMKKR